MDPRSSMDPGTPGPHRQEHECRSKIRGHATTAGDSGPVTCSCGAHVSAEWQIWLARLWAGGGLTPGSGTCHRTLTWDSHTCIQQDAAWLARIYGSSKQQAHPCCRRLQCVIVACALRGMT